MLVKTKHSYYVFIVLTFVLSGLAILKYVSLHSTVLDLGIFLNSFYKMGVYGQWHLFSVGHLQPLLIPLSLLLNLFPSSFLPYLLLLLQGALLSLPAVWIVRRYGYAALGVYIVFFPLWYNALNDFHMDHMVVPLMFGFFLFAEEKKIWLAVACASCAALVKEPFALQAAACGIFLIITARKILAGTLLFIFGTVYFFVAIRYLVPYFSAGHFAPGIQGLIDAPAFSWMGCGIGEKLLFMVKHPVTIISEVVSNVSKIKYLFFIFGVLAFIPILRPVMLVPALPIMGIALLSGNDAHYAVTNHYTAGLIAPFIMAFIKGLPAAGSLWKKVRLTEKMFVPVLITVLMLGHVWLAPSFLFRFFWIPMHWERYFKAYIPTERDAIIKKAILNNIPADPDITISTENNINWGYLVYRKHLMVFPHGVIAATDIISPPKYRLTNLMTSILQGERPLAKIERQFADYAVIDLKRPFFVDDKGCQWYYGKCTDKDMEGKFLDAVNKAYERFDIIYEMDGFMILKRKI